MNKVYFLDIDDCLIRTSALTEGHLKVIRNRLAEMDIKKNGEITREFARSFRRLYDQHQGKYLSPVQKTLLADYMERMEELEKPVREKFGLVKKWSRELCLYIAGEKSGLDLPNDILVSCATALWEKIADYAVFYPDALIFLKKLINQKQPFYLITASDSRLVKDDKTGLFHYDPDYSRKFKLKRLKKILDLGVNVNHIFIGDPIDKPNIKIFSEALEMAKKENPYPFESVMISDSYANDLEPASRAGMEKLVLLSRHREEIPRLKIPARIINSFAEI